MPTEGNFNVGIAPPVVITYAGPGNVVAGATAWWGLRAYTAASIGSNVVKIRRSSDSTTKIFVSQADGGIDQTDVFFDGSNYFVDTLYDQTGNGYDLAQATAGNQPKFFLNGIGALPIMVGVNGSNLNVAKSTFTAIAQPYTFTGFALRSVNFTSFSGIVVNDSSIGIYFNNTVNTITLFATSPLSVTAADKYWWDIQAVGNGASSSITAGGTTTSGNAGSSSTNGAVPIVALSDDTAESLAGGFTEGGIWPSGFSAGNVSSMSSNQRTYWIQGYDVDALSWQFYVVTN